MIEMIEMMPEVTWPVPCLGCDWCGGSGWWTDPKDGKQYPCIKCQPATD